MARRMKLAPVAAVVLALVPLVALSASSASSPLSPYLQALAEKGTPVAGKLLRDGTAQIDVYASGKVTRFTFDAKANLISTAPADNYVSDVLTRVKTSAGAAADAAAGRDYPKDSQVRAVTLGVQDGKAVFGVALYDKNLKFLGTHLYDAADGSWQGWTDAAGEVDPLAVPKMKPGIKRSSL